MPCAVPGKAELLPRRGRPAAVWFWSDGPLPVSFPLISARTPSLLAPLLLSTYAFLKNAHACGCVSGRRALWVPWELGGPLAGLWAPSCQQGIPEVQSAFEHRKNPPKFLERFLWTWPLVR